MARARFIKPDFFKHGDLFDAERASGLPLRVAFAGLWTQADRAGRFAWKPRELKLDVLPYDDVDFAAVLTALETAGFVRSYVVDGKRYGVIPTLTDHQPFHVREPQSKLPAPPEKGEPVPSKGSAGHSAGTVQGSAEHRAGRSTTATVTVTDTVTATEKDISPVGESPNSNGVHPIPAVRQPKPPKGPPAEDVEAVLAHYRERHPKRHPERNAKNLTLIRKHLADYSVADLCRAIDGNAKSQWHTDKGKQELSYVLSTADLIDGFIERADYRPIEEIPYLERDPALAYAMGVAT